MSIIIMIMIVSKIMTKKLSDMREFFYYQMGLSKQQAAIQMQ